MKLRIASWRWVRLLATTLEIMDPAKVKMTSVNIKLVATFYRSTLLEEVIVEFNCVN